MEARMKDVRRSFLALFGVALVVAVVGRIGLAVMDLAGVLTYDYIAASTGTLLNQVCSALKMCIRDSAIIWASIEYDFPELEQFCIAYCEERGCPIN